jgi:hypothetical protein
MISRFRTGSLLAAAAGIVLMAAPAFAQSGVTKDELKCESGAGKSLAKFVGAQGKCAQKCLAAARKTSGPYGGCFGPGYTDPTMNACVFDAAKGTEAKAKAAIIKGCTKDCPECYADNSPNTCTTGEPLVGDTQTQLALFGSLVYCLENGGNTPTKIEAKCEDSVSMTLAKFVGAKSKCYDKCSANEFNGKVAPGSCAPPASDPATQTCIASAEGKAAAAIDKACAAAGANPACYVPGFDTGAEWVALTEAAVDGQYPNVACGSPSGAFLD